MHSIRSRLLAVAGAVATAALVMGLLSPVGTKAATAQGCPCSIWPASATPAVASAADNSSVEVGVRFRSDVSGYITALRFYKGAGNTGTHTGHLWTNDGTLLSTVTFTGETAGGWQQATLPTPVPISANTTYVASYHTDTGYYSYDYDYFAGKGTDAPPLHALADGTDGPNGVYHVGPSAFPTDTYRSMNYWVDVVFDDAVADTTPPALSDQSPPAGSTAAATNTSLTATFTEPVQSSTISMTLRGPSGPIAGTRTYDAPSAIATFTPTAPLALSTSYTATVSGAEDMFGNTMAPVTWSFTTAASSTQSLTQGPGGPILLVTSTSNPFSSYYAEILRTEGLNEFATVDLSRLSTSTLSGHDVVVLGEMSLTSTQVSLLTNFVNNGGSLIAMRPGTNLTTLLRLRSPSGSVTDGYIGVNTAVPAAAGITSATMQFHGTANEYALAGATRVATLYSSATQATTFPAVTLATVGTRGGQVAAFTYDLARSVVQTRQGNPAWAGQARDGYTPIRSDDLFYGGTQPDWVNLSKVAIPQADEQQRLFANLVETMETHRMPLPRLWYFPNDLKAVIVGTGDDHGANGGGTAGRFEEYQADSPAGCSVTDWTCLRFTSYVFPIVGLTDAQAISFTAQGFEVGLHPTTDCTDFTDSSLSSDLTSQLAQWSSVFVGVPSPTTSRTHCVPWSDWVGQPTVELAHGIRLDTNYYYWPPSWIQDRPGLFTGSGIPMRFAQTNGTTIDVYQATTQMTDESDQSYPLTVDTLLNNALGANGYYGAFTVNMHADIATTYDSDEVIASALAHHVPIVSAEQMLTWLDGRNSSSFKNLSWSSMSHSLSFSVATGAGAYGLTVDLPMTGSTGSLSSLTLGGTPVGYTVETIKGLQYAVFPAGIGTYRATYSGVAGASRSVPTAAPITTAVPSGPLASHARAAGIHTPKAFRPEPTGTTGTTEGGLLLGGR